jgi:hypothetical protein
MSSGREQTELHARGDATIPNSLDAEGHLAKDSLCLTASRGYGPLPKPPSSEFVTAILVTFICCAAEFGKAGLPRAGSRVVVMAEV